jgi:hypothetical protein
MDQKGNRWSDVCPETKAEEDRDLQKQRLTHTYVFSATIANAEAPRMRGVSGDPTWGRSRFIQALLPSQTLCLVLRQNFRQLLNSLPKSLYDLAV